MSSNHLKVFFRNFACSFLFFMAKTRLKEMSLKTEKGMKEEISKIIFALHCRDMYFLFKYHKNKKMIKVKIQILSKKSVVKSGRILMQNFGQCVPKTYICTYSTLPMGTRVRFLWFSFVKNVPLFLA